MNEEQKDITVRMPRELIKRIDDAAKSVFYTNRSELIRRFAREGLEKQVISENIGVDKS